VAVAVTPKDIAALDDREDSPLVGNQAEVHGHKLIGLGHALGADDAEVVHISVLLKDAHAALVAALRVATEAVDPAGVEPAGDIEKALALQERVLRAEEEAEGVLGALRRREPVAEVALIADRQNRARARARLERCASWSASPWKRLGEVERRLAHKRHAGLPTERCGDAVAAPVAHGCGSRAERGRVAGREGDGGRGDRAGRTRCLKQHQVVGLVADGDARFLDGPAVLGHEVAQGRPARARGADVGVVRAIARHRCTRGRTEEGLGSIRVLAATGHTQSDVATVGGESAAGGEIARVLQPAHTIAGKHRLAVACAGPVEEHAVPAVGTGGRLYRQHEVEVAVAEAAGHGVPR